MAGICRQRRQDRMENSKMKTKIIFMGTPQFGVVTLKRLLEKNYEPVLIVTAPDKPVGRKKIVTPSPVKTFAKRRGLAILQPFRLTEIKEEIKKIKPDLIIVAAYGYILPKEIFEMPKYGTLNIHPSLLPKYRGPSPIQATIMAGDRKSGVTIIKIDDVIDHGSILAQETIDVSPKVIYKDLEKKLAELGANLLTDILPKWLKGEIKPKDQNDLFASFTKIIEKADGKVNWTNSSAKQVERSVRALQPWPSTYTYWKQKGKGKKLIKILEAKPTDSSRETTPGKVYCTEKDKIIIQCGEGSLIVKKLQLEGKNLMTDKEFILGHEGFIGSVLT